MVGEAVIDVSVELPKAIAALYGTVDFVSQLLLIAAYLVGLFLLAPWMTAVSIGLLAVTALLLLGLFQQSLRTSAEITSANRGFGTFLVERLRSLRLIQLCAPSGPNSRT